MIDPHRQHEDIAAQNNSALRTLNRALTLSEGQFSLILARCNYATLRGRIVEKLREQCPVQIQELFLPASVKMLYATIQTELAKEQPEALMVFGLESVSAIDEVLTSTNLVRDEFPQSFRFPLVLWVNDEVLQKLIRLAPDFETYATAFEFALTTEELIDFIRQNTERVFSAVLNAGAGQFLPNSTILSSPSSSELKSARTELQKRGVKLEPALEAGLQFILGRDDYANHQIEAALEHYQQSLNFWQEQVNNHHPTLAQIPLSPHPTSISYHSPEFSLDRQWLGVVLFHIGLCYRRQADRHRAESRRYWQEARRHLGQCIEVFEHAGHQDLVAKFINQLGEVLRDLEAWEDLAVLAQKSLQLHQTGTHQVQLAQDYGFLAEVALHQSNWQQAQQYAQQALAIQATAPVQTPQAAATGPHHRGLYRLLLAQALDELGQHSEAVARLETARQESQPQYDPWLYLQILEKLQKLYFQQSQYLDAFHIKQEQRAIEAQYGFRAFIGAGRLQPQRHAINPALEPVSATVTEDITASVRQKDVQRLLTRMSTAQNKLTVIHGQSGVGKSSIVMAGLVPALKQTNVGTREALPVVQQVYTDWIAELGKTLVQELKTLKNGRFSPSSNPATLNSAAAILEQLQKNGERNLLTVLIFDQFEEFFFVWKEQAKRQEFFEFLRVCLNIPFVKVIIALREDYLHYLLECSRLTQLDAIDNDILGKDILYYLGNFTPKDATEVIKNLTDRAQFYLEPALIQELVRDLASETGEVRPIELQVVGSQLQAENITTLEDYKQKGPKQKLVERFLEEAIEDCGQENENAARFVLYSLTDENDTRPLKTRAELAADLASVEEASKLDLVLEILVESGLIFRLREVPAELYQLVHDYLVAFIRQQQKSDRQAEFEELQKQNKLNQDEIEKLRRDKELLAQLAKTKEEKSQVEERLNRNQKWQLRAAVAGLVLLAGMTAMALHQRQLAENAQTEALQSASKALVLSIDNDQLGVLANSVKIGQSAKETSSLSAEIKNQIAQRLRQTVSRVQESNRLVGHKNKVLSVSYSPDGQTIASASADSTINLWRPDGKLLRTLTGHDGNVTSITFSPDGQTIASAGTDNTIRLWRLNDGQLLKTFKGTNNKVIFTSISFSPDGQIIASASTDKTINLWNLDGKALRTLKGHKDWVVDVSFSPDSQTLASASVDGTVKLWNKAGKELKTLNKEHTGGVYRVSFSPNGQTFASASADNTIKLWRISDGTVINTLKGHSDVVYSVSFSRDGQTLASGSADNTVKLWNIDGTVLKTLRGHQDVVRAVSFSPDGQTIVSASDDQTVKLWSRDSTPLPRALVGHSNWVYSVSFSRDGQRLATGSSDNTVKLWNIDGTLIKNLERHEDAVNSVSFSPDGQFFASGSADSTVKLWSKDGTLIKNLDKHEDAVNSVTFSPDGEMIASGSADKTVKLWSKDGKELQTLEHEESVNSVTFSPDGQTIATASADKMVKLWSKAGKELKTLNYEASINSVTFSPNGEMIASAGASPDNSVKLWSKDGTLLKTLPHDASVNSVAFSPDGETIATASADKMVKLWRTDGTLIATLNLDDVVNSVNFSPDGQTLALASSDKTVILWRLGDLDLDSLIVRGCGWLRNYLTNNAGSESEGQLCDGVATR
ncbi:PD40 domain-containing protein [Microcoleus sp. FACHB-68]|uniref:WD40 domain-containing protein n=1 Tax=Microcoleus sp. FACHB-68 TaxID=2692826 RepID=UPI001687EF51|nr:PD40 domain-containing protein [Microcoleus sp. FACHB-68]MBD1938185.1 PD40 domain-containing protein [Microcoleus sp. FACHB-68]